MVTHAICAPDHDGNEVSIYEEDEQTSEESFSRITLTDTFEKLSVIGQGTYGKVYKARNKKTGSLVALKKIFIHNKQIGIPTTAVREIGVLKELRHPNIVPLRNVIIDQRKARLFLEFDLIQMDLRDYMKCFHNRRMPMISVRSIIRQILLGLQHCHGKNIVHRDLKPSNILIDPQPSGARLAPTTSRANRVMAGNHGHERVFVADFGLARYQPEAKKDLTHEVVTLWYRAPEVILGRNDYDFALDMWSVGCILGELIYGRALFAGESEVTTLYKMFQVLGTPSKDSWVASAVEFNSQWPQWPPRPDVWYQLRPGFMEDTEYHLAVDLLTRLLRIDPRERPSVD
ncbi:MAG: hypothetical protein KVP17_001579, partial [Porospora cf. gigantea B]|uniref:uncharacterized protein n=1 Tax=Porospora cf. gigantea B TaxID=2853592 RepID=UPI003571AA57